MRPIVRYTLLVLLLVPAMVQSGMSIWTPRLCGEMAHDADSISARSGLAPESHAHHDLHGASGQALDGNGAHHGLTCIGCPDAHDVMLLSAGSFTCVSEHDVYENPAIAAVTNIDLVPPTPPPRS